MKIKFLFLSIYPIIFLNYVNVSAAIKKTETAMLYEATLQDNFEKTQEHLQRLISSGIDINSEESDDEELKGFTALHMASYYGLYSGIPRLLAVGANINKPVGPSNKQFAGMTALQLAIICNLPLVLHELLQNHAIIDCHRSGISTSSCFDRFVKMVCPDFSKMSESVYEKQLIKIVQKKVLDMAKELILAGLKFDQETKDYVLRSLGINLDSIK